MYRKKKEECGGWSKGRWREGDRVCVCSQNMARLTSAISMSTLRAQFNEERESDKAEVALALLIVGVHSIVRAAMQAATKCTQLQLVPRNDVL